MTCRDPPEQHSSACTPAQPLSRAKNPWEPGTRPACAALQLEAPRLLPPASRPSLAAISENVASEADHMWSPTVPTSPGAPGSLCSPCSPGRLRVTQPRQRRLKQGSQTPASACLPPSKRSPG